MTLNKIQSREAAGLLTGHNTLKRHLHLLGLLASPLCRKYGVKEETVAHILCECEALASLRHVCLGSFFLEPEDIRSLGLEVIWNYSKVMGLP
jgi:ferredoxin-thioredoxin reductase catalytic subunit